MKVNLAMVLLSFTWAFVNRDSWASKCLFSELFLRAVFTVEVEFEPLILTFVVQTSTKLRLCRLDHMSRINSYLVGRKLVSLWGSVLE